MEPYMFKQDHEGKEFYRNKWDNSVFYKTVASYMDQTGSVGRTFDDPGSFVFETFCSPCGGHKI